MRIGGISAILLLLAGCGLVDGRNDNRPVPRSDQQGQRLPPPSGDLRQCLSGLDRAGVQYRRLPNREFSGGCHARGAVQLLQVGVPTRNLGAMTCPLADRYGRWVRDVLQPAARRHFGSQATRVDVIATYSCRQIAGSSRISEHGKANAIDIRAFVIDGERQVSVLEGWNGDRRERAFLRDLHQGACRTFEIVLGPDANAAHRDHFHFDMGSRGPYCR
ncbi:MAG: extensin family protein [Sphingomonadaceae bacterium]|nr:extensin family protein [Sphingomonadaceae bacterium]